MTDDRSFERAARSWLEVGPTEAPDRVVEAALLRIQTTPQERDLRIPWRFPTMTTPARVAAAAVIGVLAIGGALFVLRPGLSSVGGPGLSPIASPSPTAGLSPAASSSPVGPPEGPLPAGTYTITPFAHSGSDACLTPPQPGCVDPTNDDSVRVTFAVPDGWSGSADSITLAAEANTAPDGAGLLFQRGASLYEEPCRTASLPDVPPEIPVGPTVADFADAVAAHPRLDVTTPIDVTLGGYSGKYLDLQVPADITSCDLYRPWEPWFFAQGPGQRWHLWILDVDGIRVVVTSTDYAGTSLQRRTQLEAIVDSIQIQP
jgi:hypothetical protein